MEIEQLPEAGGQMTLCDLIQAANSCPTCGSKVTVYTGREGTSSFVPFPLDELVAVAEAARPLCDLAGVAHNGDPWYAEHEGLDGDEILRHAGDALAALDARLREE
jgi:hypothetical protein